ncbi:hypothetical protein BDZ91DRAFT_730556 [Kalaharituber pfeilii]|nr:hypothetical protein BDZ91DRAFT_730556 [Kalaharituber pfeilii]
MHKKYSSLPPFAYHRIAYTKYYMTARNYDSSHSQVAVEEVAEMSESARNAETGNMSYC